MNHISYKVIIFDLGGVLVKLIGVPRMMELCAGQGLTVHEMWRRWLTSPAVRLYESGKLTSDEFGRRIVKEFGMDIPPSRYLEEFALWPAGKYPGVNELLTSVKKRIAIASLSNTNDLHWTRMVSEMDFLHLFDYNFPSHLTGRLKPDAEAFLLAATEMGIRSDEALFLDDNRINVEGAKKTGMDAVEVHGVEGVRECLASVGMKVP